MRKSYLFRYVTKINKDHSEDIEYVVLEYDSLEKAIEVFKQIENFGYNVYLVDSIPCFSTDSVMQKQIEFLHKYD